MTRHLWPGVGQDGGLLLELRVLLERRRNENRDFCVKKTTNNKKNKNRM